jgi:hypothetical protein
MDDGVNPYTPRLRAIDDDDRTQRTTTGQICNRDCVTVRLRHSLCQRQIHVKPYPSSEESSLVKFGIVQ